MSMHEMSKRKVAFENNTYSSRDNKSGKEVPHSIKCGGNYSSNVEIWRHSHSHHPIKGEI